MRRTRQRASDTERMPSLSLHPSRAAVHRAAALDRDPGVPLDRPTRALFEPRFGLDFGRVRVHHDGAAGEVARNLDARALAIGEHLVFAPGQFAPETPRGRHLLAHELAHVAQPREAAAPSGMASLSTPGDLAEREARAAADDVAGGRRPHLRAAPAAVIQREEGSMADVVKDMRSSMGTFFAAQDEFARLNGKSMENLLEALYAQRDSGQLQKLIDNFDAATGVHRSRLWVAMHAARLKGATTPERFSTDYAGDLGKIAESDQRQAVLTFLGAPKAAEAKPAEAKPAGAPAAPAAPASTGGFTPRSYSMSKTPVTLVRAREKSVTKQKGKEVVVPGRTEIKEAPADFTAAVLELAGLKPADWYASFTSLSFLGFTVSDVHTDLATHLKTVEQKFIADYGGDTKDPKVAGQTLGLKQHIGGGRHAPTGTAISMHLFGLAIDVNYDTNPWIAEESSGKEENGILARATLLVDGTSSSFAANMSYDKLAALNTAVKTYFSYIDDRSALEAKLSGATGFWAGKTADAAAKQVKADFDRLAVLWERTGTMQDAIKRGGFLDLKKELVEGMGLDWGGKYGDMMHFDMRNKGNGAKINGAGARYKAQTIAKSEAKYAEEHPE
jgi:hypothetical protein